MGKKRGQPGHLADDTHRPIWQDRQDGNQEPEVDDFGAARRKANKALKPKQSARDKLNAKAEVVGNVAKEMNVFEEIPAVKRLLHEDLVHRERLAGQLQKPFNDYVHSLPHATYLEKRALCIAANLALRKFGMAVRCPKTGRASLLLASPGHHPEIGRFQLVNLNESGERVRPVSNPELPQLLELMPEDLSRSVKVRGETWLERVKLKSAPSISKPDRAH